MRIREGMVLAAGLGTRMRPLTDDRPKALVEVAGKALIDHAIDRLAREGVERVVVNVHAFADRLEAHLAARGASPEIVISDERALLLDTGGALAKARPLFETDLIVTANCDTLPLHDEARPLAALLDGWRADAMDLRLLLAAKRDCTGWDGDGDFDLDPGGRILRTPEPPRTFHYVAMALVKPSLFDAAPVAPFSMWEVWNRALAAQRMTGAAHQAHWLHVGDPAARDAAELMRAEAKAAEGARS